MQKTKHITKITHKKKSKPNMQRCKNCSHVSAQHCAQLSCTTVAHNTEQF